jgi:hypothetical protein
MGLSAGELVIAGITVFIVVTIVRGLAGFTARHGIEILIFRFLSGRLLHGERHTDARFFTPGTRVLHPSGHASKWAHRPHSHRMAVRWTVMGFTGGTAYGLLTAPDVTIGCLAAAALGGICLVQRATARKIRFARHQRTTVGPLTTAVAAELGMSEQAAAGSVQISPGFTAAGGREHVGTIILPDSYAATPAQRDAMEHLLRSRLGIDPAFDWRTAAYPMTLRVSVAPRPPAMVPIATVMGVIRGLPQDHVLLGVNGHEEYKEWDLSGEDPHCMVSANTRRGKTRLLLLITGQILAQGGSTVIIDPKRVGVDTALAGVPAAVVHSDPRDIAGMWQGIRDFRKMMEDRIDAYMTDRTLEFPRALLCIDELSQFSSMSKVYWDSVREKGSRATPEIWNDVAAILWQGAQFKCSVLVFGQRIEHSTLAGLVDSFGTRLLAGYQKRTHERLVGLTYKPSAKQRGRFLYFDGTEQTMIQTVLANDQEIRDLALSGQAKPDTMKTQIIQGEVAA